MVDWAVENSWWWLPSVMVVVTVVWKYGKGWAAKTDNKIDDWFVDLLVKAGDPDTVRKILEKWVETNRKAK